MTDSTLIFPTVPLALSLSLTHTSTHILSHTLSFFYERGTKGYQKNWIGEVWGGKQRESEGTIMKICNCMRSCHACVPRCMRSTFINHSKRLHVYKTVTDVLCEYLCQTIHMFKFCDSRSQLLMIIWTHM